MKILIVTATIIFSIFIMYYSFTEAERIRFSHELTLPKIVQPSTPKEAEVPYAIVANLLHNVWASANKSIQIGYESVTKMHRIIIFLLVYILILTLSFVVVLIKKEHKQ